MRACRRSRRSARPPLRRSPGLRRGPIRSRRPSRPRRRQRLRRRACGPRSRRGRVRARRAAQADGTSFSIENERTASSTRATAETWQARRSQMHRPRARPTSGSRSAGAETTPDTTTRVLLERDQRRPHRDPPRVVARPVDRVDDPAARAVRRSRPLPRRAPRRRAVLVGEHPSELRLDGAVGLGDRASGRAWSRP